MTQPERLLLLALVLAVDPASASDSCDSTSGGLAAESVFASRTEDEGLDRVGGAGATLRVLVLRGSDMLR